MLPILDPTLYIDHVCFKLAILIGIHHQPYIEPNIGSTAISLDSHSYRTYVCSTEFQKGKWLGQLKVSEAKCQGQAWFKILQISSRNLRREKVWQHKLLLSKFYGKEQSIMSLFWAPVPHPLRCGCGCVHVCTQEQKWELRPKVNIDVFLNHLPLNLQFISLERCRDPPVSISFI